MIYLLIWPVTLGRCRHAVFTRHFGDDPPDCGKQCDVCLNAKQVEKLIAGYFRVSRICAARV